MRISTFIHTALHTTGNIMVLWCVMLLPACGLARGPSEPIHSYVLEVEEGRELSNMNEMRSQGRPTLLVSLPDPAPGFESSRMVYVKMSHELNFYAASQWVESPAAMLAPLIVQRLESSGLWGAVAHMPTPVRGDLRLDIDEVALAQEFLQEPSRVRLSLRAQVLTISDPHVLGTRRFDIREEAPSEDAYGGVLAAQWAVRQLLDDLQEWLGQCVRDDQVQGC